MEKDPVRMEKEEKPSSAKATEGKEKKRKKEAIVGQPMREIIEKAKEEICRYTSLPFSTILGVSQEEGGWRVGIEMVEKKSIPESQDILAHYEVRLDEKGQLIDFNRTGLRKRADTAGY